MNNFSDKGDKSDKDDKSDKRNKRDKSGNVENCVELKRRKICASTSVVRVNYVSNAICGTFHQGSSEVFPGRSVGNQCTCNGLIALCVLPIKNHIEKHDLDF